MLGIDGKIDLLQKVRNIRGYILIPSNCRYEIFCRPHVVININIFGDNQPNFDQDIQVVFEDSNAASKLAKS